MTAIDWNLIRIGDWSTEETIKHLYYDKGLSLADAATTLGVDKCALRRKMIELDLFPRKHKEDKKRQEVRALLFLNPSISTRELTRRVHCAYQTAARYKKEWQLEEETGVKNLPKEAACLNPQYG